MNDAILPELGHLERLTQLKELDLPATVSPEEIRKLVRVLPNTRIDPSPLYH